MRGGRADHRTVRASRRITALWRLGAVALAATLLVAIPAADGAMRSKKLNNRLCETTGGGRFVKIPGFPGERIDRRLLRDIRWMRKRWPIFITDGHSTDPVHSANGEHPLGLALDIVPHRAEGGRWRHITRLANWAEPNQNQPRMPFRWVGYDGDAGHGRGHHLHLSWSHSPAKFNRPARTVWTVKCPTRPKTTDDTKDGSNSGPTGGMDGSDSSGDTGSGGISARMWTRQGVDATRLAPVAPETGGVSAR